MIIPVIPGTRLWPLSRKMYPKQLLALTSDQTLLQQTASRRQGTKNVSAGELAELAKEVIGFVGNRTFDSTKPERTTQKLLEVIKLKQLDWKAATSLREGIASTYES